MSLLTNLDPLRLPPLHLPLFPWREPRALSQLTGDTVYTKDAFPQALRLLDRLNVPLGLGTVGVHFPNTALTKSDQSALTSLPDNTRALTLRGVVECDEHAELPWREYRQLAQFLSGLGWWGIEIRTPQAELSWELMTVAQESKSLGLHPSLSVVPAAITPQNTPIIRQYSLISVDMTNVDSLTEEQISCLHSDVLIAEVIPAGQAETVNLEQALTKLVMLQAALPPTMRLGVGLAGANFPSVNSRNHVLETAETDTEEFLVAQQVDPLEKIHTALHLVTALAFGKEEAAFAFAADQVRQAAEQAAQPLPGVLKKTS